MRSETHDTVSVVTVQSKLRPRAFSCTRFPWPIMFLKHYLKSVNFIKDLSAIAAVTVNVRNQTELGIKQEHIKNQ